MDLLIATAARTHDAPVVTRNMRDFERVPGLDVVSYRERLAAHGFAKIAWSTGSLISVSLILMSRS